MHEVVKERVGMSGEELRVLELSLSGGCAGSFEAVMREDFRKIEARFVCTAKRGEETRCVRFVSRFDGCTFFLDGLCCAENS